jgi:16S rRNA (guanine(966)-N(2))-methyltransferase RsmD
VREALFSILGLPPEDAAVLDLFCGGGTLAIEALSRGAASAVLVDANRPAQRAARGNLEALDLADRTELIASPVIAALRALRRREPQPRFHWIFCDPPYASDLANQTLADLGDGALLTPGAVVVVEHDKRRAPAAGVGCLVRTDQRRYGDTELSLYTPDST